MTMDPTSEVFPPNNALKVFEPVIGVWDTVGTHPMVDSPLHGRASFEWHESGAFIIQHTSIEDSRFPDGVAIFASDDALGIHSMVYFDERGVSRIHQVRMDGNVLRWWRDAPGFSQRYSLTISEDQQSMVGKGELSKDGVTWEKDLDLNYTRTKT
ncbi:hypothetical protein H0X32_03150 [Patescibacteria group bacterium]|nr:hypothetical protein [Patescibacteria group bacterium]